MDELISGLTILHFIAPVVLLGAGITLLFLDDTLFEINSSEKVLLATVCCLSMIIGFVFYFVAYGFTLEALVWIIVILHTPRGIVCAFLLFKEMVFG